MQSNRVAGCETDGPVILLRYWFGSDLQIEKNWSNVTTLVQTWSQRHLSLLGMAEVVWMYIELVLTYRLTVELWPDLRLNNLK